MTFFTRLSRYLPLAWIARVRALRDRLIGFKAVSLPDEMKRTLWGSEQTARIIHAEADPAKVADADILGLVLKREQEREKQSGRVIQIQAGRVR